MKGERELSKLSSIMAIRETDEAKLMATEAKSIEALLETSATRKSRTGLAEKSGISEKLILEWANQADVPPRIPQY